MIKTLEVSLGQLGVPSLLDPPALVAGQVLATGWYVDQVTGQYYYYDARNDQWYYYAAGYLYALAISWKPSPSAMLNLMVGDTLRIMLSFKYLGPAITGKQFHAAIGENPSTIPPSLGTDFAEIKAYIVSFNIPKCDTPTTITGNYIDCLIPSAAAGHDLAAYVKWEQALVEEGKSTTPLYYNVAHVAPAAGEFSEFAITSFVKV